jgi:hypothetical protein
MKALEDHIIEQRQSDPLVVTDLSETNQMEAEWRRLQKEYQQLIGAEPAWPEPAMEAAIAQPSNDTCAGATSITCPGSITQSTIGATDDGPNDCTNRNFNTVWFTFTGDGAVHTFSTVGSDYDTVLQVFTGSCGGLTSVACNDDCDPVVFGPSCQTFIATAGVTYFIRVTDFFDFGGGTLVLSCVTLQLPVAVCHDVTVSADSNCQANVTPQQVDNGSTDPDGTIVDQTLTPPGPYGLGTTTVTLTVTDNDGLTDTCTATITVEDTTAPIITCPADITAECTSPAGATVMYTAPTASDTCDTTPTVTCTSASGSTFPIGTTTVTCTASDDHGNTSLPCTFTVQVVDTTAPTINCPANITVTENPPSSGSAVVTFAATASDTCDSTPTVMCSPASGSMFPIGTTTVTCTATDDSGNSAMCSFMVTVTPACTITCPANITVNNDPGQCGANVSFAPTTTGNCGTVTCTPASGSFFPVGPTTVTCTTSAGPMCSFTVTVNDAEAPVITFTGPITLSPPNHQYVTLTLAQLVASVTDNCDTSVGVSSVVITKVSSDEPEDARGNGDGNTLNDIVIAADCKSVQLRRERADELNGRVYTITVKVADASGNVRIASRTVTVPIGPGSGPAVDDGAAAGYMVISNCGP